MKPSDVKSNTSIDSSEKVNNKDRQCKIDDIVRMLKYKKKPFCKRLHSKLVWRSFCG